MADPGNRPPRAPKFSWDTLPVFVHSSNSSGPVNDAAVALMAKFSLVTVEKFQSNDCSGDEHVGPWCHEEVHIIDVLRRVRMINPNATTIFYYNSVINFEQYSWSGNGFPSTLLLRNNSGDLITVHGPQSATQSVFDFGLDAARRVFIDECVNATRTGWVDGCFADRVMDGSPCCSPSSDDVHSAATHTVISPDAAKVGGAQCSSTSSPLSPTQCAAYQQGHMDVISNLTEAIAPGPIIANHAFTTAPGLYPAQKITGSMTEGLPQDEDGIALLQWHAARGLVLEAHVAACPGPGSDRTSTLAHFLIGAGRLSYFGCGGWSSTEQSWDDRWFDEFERPLGPPVADGVKDNATGMWTRSFDGPHGRTNVSWSASVGGTIDWAGYPPPPPPTPPQPNKQCPNISTGCSVTGSSGGAAGFPTSWSSCCNLCTRHSHPVPGRSDPCHVYEWTSTNPDGCKLYGRNATIVPTGGPAGSVCGTVQPPLA